MHTKAAADVCRGRGFEVVLLGRGDLRMGRNYLGRLEGRRKLITIPKSTRVPIFLRQILFA